MGNECLPYCQCAVDMAVKSEETEKKKLIDTDSDITITFCRFNCAAVTFGCDRWRHF